MTKADLRALLAGCEPLGLPSDIQNDTYLAIDSFALLWIGHQLEETYGLVINPHGADRERFSSVDAIYEYLTERFPGHFTEAGTP